MYSPLSEEVPAPGIKWGGENIGSNSSNLPIQTKTFKSPHTFAGLRNAPYSSYRSANKIEIPFLKLSMLAASQSPGAAVPYLRGDLAGTPLPDVCASSKSAARHRVTAPQGADPVGWDSAWCWGRLLPCTQGGEDVRGTNPASATVPHPGGKIQPHRAVNEHTLVLTLRRCDAPCSCGNSREGPSWCPESPPPPPHRPLLLLSKLS